MDAILLVGGFGSRLMPLTKHRPKPLMPLANIPFTERTIAWLGAAGIDHVILSVHYNTAQFIEHFSSNKLGVKVSFACEEHPLGTGGAISNCAPHLQSARCLVVNGDIFTDLDLPALMAAHHRTQALVSIALKTVTDPSRYGVIELNAEMGICSFTEKPTRALALSNEINAGIYLLERRAFDHFPTGASSVERDVFPAMLRSALPLFGFRSRPYWTDLGTPQDYLQAHEDILRRRVAVPLHGTELTPGVWVGEQARIAKDAVLRAPLLLGNRATIESGAVIGPNLVLGDDVHIGRRAHLRDSVLWDGADVLDDSMILGSIAGQQAQLGGVIQGGLCADFGAIHHIASRRSGVRVTDAAAPVTTVSRPAA
ncbi:MAG: sugar phosphate nucleotidyltransferase [Armatimonadota bacterium]